MGKRSTERAAGGHGSITKAIIGALITALFLKLFLFDFMIAEGHSMEPSIMPGKVLLVCKLVYGIRIPGSGAYLLRWASPREGDIVVFYTPLGEIAVKRCGEISLENYFYALGDNSLHSYDSRSYGPVLMDNIVGKVLGIR
ncbi:MAG: signal peptidase I [Treponema sp.]|jgi:signal peptidase I|nr:signal peptidase I [Treponema sp.]